MNDTFLFIVAERKHDDQNPKKPHTVPMVIFLFT